MNSNDLENNNQNVQPQLNFNDQNKNASSGPKKRGRKKKVPLDSDDDDEYIPQNANEITEIEENTENKNDGENDNLTIPEENKESNNINSLPKKRGRKKKVLDASEGDNDVEIISSNENMPKKRGRKKKNKDSNDSDYVPSNYEPDKDSNDNNNNKTQNINVEVKNGINDLTNLPIELLRMELVQRGYHEGVINRLDKWYLVSMLRENAYNHFNYFSFCSSRFGINSWERNDGPMEKIFENDPETERKRLEEQRLKKEEREKEDDNIFDEDSINADEFSKEKIKKNRGKFKRMYEYY